MKRKLNILLGVTGSIAAYKAAHLTRLMVKAGMDVRVVMTPSATDFITPLTLSSLSRHPVNLRYFDEESGEWNSHVELGLWADAMLIAPATANTMAAMAAGSADNLLLASYLSARCPVFFAPAMDLDMFSHPATQRNVARLKEYGNIIIDAESGELASGLEGKGRMAEPEHILQALVDYFAGMTGGGAETDWTAAGSGGAKASGAVRSDASGAGSGAETADAAEGSKGAGNGGAETVESTAMSGGAFPSDSAFALAAPVSPAGSAANRGAGPLAGRRALVTAGPTYEPLDPVRFIGNRSSGKMGYALSRRLAEAGAEVFLVSGPGSQILEHPRVRIRRVETAAEMAEAAMAIFPDCDIAVLAAAVADYRPAEVHQQKMKKGEGDMRLHLERTIDIAAELGKMKRPDQFVAGFAMETENERENAREKLGKKNFDMIVLNSLGEPGAGFAGDTNRVTMFFPDGTELEEDLAPKDKIAGRIVDAMTRRLPH